MEQIGSRDFKEVAKEMEITEALDAKKTLDIDPADISKFKEKDVATFLEASKKFNLLEEVEADPNDRNNTVKNGEVVTLSDGRLVFAIDNKSYSYNKEAFLDEDGELDIKVAGNLLELEDKLLQLEIRDREIKGISNKTLEKAKMLEFGEEVKQREEAMLSPEEKALIQEYIDDTDAALKRWDKKFESVEEEKDNFKNTALEGQLKKIEEANHVSEIIKSTSMALDLEDEEQPGRNELQKQFNIDYRLRNLELAKEKAADILIKKEVFKNLEARENVDDFRELKLYLQSELTEGEIAQSLSEEDLISFYKDRFIDKKDLFSASELTEEEEEEKAELLHKYGNLAKREMLVKSKDLDIDVKQWPYENIRQFLSSTNPSVHEMADFLAKEDTEKLYDFYLNPENSELFDNEGRAVGEGKKAIELYLEKARKTAELNEFEDAHKIVEEELRSGLMGKSIDAALEELEQRLNAVTPRSRAERWFARGAAVREKNRKETEIYRKLKPIKEEIEQFKKYYFKRKTEYILENRRFERKVIEKLEAKGIDLGNENLDRRTRSEILSYSVKLRNKNIDMNRRISDGLEHLLAIDSEGILDGKFQDKNLHSENSKSIADFIDSIKSPLGWKNPTSDAEKERRAGTTFKEERLNFGDSVDRDWDPIRKVMLPYLRKQPGKEAQVTKLEGGGTLEGHPSVEREITDEMANFLKLNSGGVIKEGAEVNIMAKIIRNDLKEELYGKGEAIPTKIIDLLKAQAVNIEQAIEVDDKFKIEMQRYCGKEKWRQRWEAAIRKVAGKKDYKLKDLNSIKDAFEVGESWVSTGYQTGLTVKETTVNAFDGFIENFNKRAKLPIHDLIEFFVPRREKTQRRIFSLVNRQGTLKRRRKQRNEKMGGFNLFGDL